MGQHTWFYKNQELRKQEIALYKQLDAHDNGEIFLENVEQIEIQINEISENNEAEYHDLFRTNKRNDDGEYTDDIILSEEECNKWLEENKDLVSWGDEEKEYRKLLDEFWHKYPTGAIDFG